MRLGHSGGRPRGPPRLTFTGTSIMGINPATGEGGGRARAWRVRSWCGRQGGQQALQESAAAAAAALSCCFLQEVVGSGGRQAAPCLLAY